MHSHENEHKHSEKEHKHGEMEDECGCGEGGCEGGHCDCEGGKCGHGEGGGDCCCEPKEMSKEEAANMLTRVATDVWMKMFIEACEKEWKKQYGKQIQKLAAEHVKKADKEWSAQMK